MIFKYQGTSNQKSNLILSHVTHDQGNKIAYKKTQLKKKKMMMIDHEHICHVMK